MPSRRRPTRRCGARCASSRARPRGSGSRRSVGSPAAGPTSSWCAATAPRRSRSATSWRGSTAIRVDIVTADFRDLESVRAAAGVLLGKHPRIDVLINSAGIHSTTLTTTAAGMETVFCVNHLASVPAHPPPAGPDEGLRAFPDHPGELGGAPLRQRRPRRPRLGAAPLHGIEGLRGLQDGAAAERVGVRRPSRRHRRHDQRHAPRRRAHGHREQQRPALPDLQARVHLARAQGPGDFGGGPLLPGCRARDGGRQRQVLPPHGGGEACGARAGPRAGQARLGRQPGADRADRPAQRPASPRIRRT